MLQVSGKPALAQPSGWSLGRLRYDGEAVWYDGVMTDTGVPPGGSSGSAVRRRSRGRLRYDGEAVWCDGGMTETGAAEGPQGSMGSRLSAARHLSVVKHMLSVT